VADLTHNHAGTQRRLVGATAPAQPEARDNSGKSVVAFISGLVGLLVGNLILGPLAIGLGIAALRGENPRRGRAILAIALGVADLAIFAFLTLRSETGHGVLWKFGS
jgi:predicted lipid-binding transport protein (Tim44 family)